MKIFSEKAWHQLPVDEIFVLLNSNL